MKDLLPLRDIAELLDPPVSHRQVTEWARRRKSTGFPEPAEAFGRYLIYDLEAVQHWYTMWLRVTSRLGRNDLNG